MVVSREWLIGREGVGTDSCSPFLSGAGAGAGAGVAGGRRQRGWEKWSNGTLLS